MSISFTQISLKIFQNEEDWDDPYESPLQRPSEIRPLTLASVLTGKKVEKVDLGSASSRKGAGEEAATSSQAANHDDKALTGAIIKTVTNFEIIFLIS